ncbi:Not1 N-terminal domain, CCR4-Not complex component-domain-containing protein [Pyronema omphalodes]|nr:Not1 N-terminal domain, CCR4-Not complex component-domain-containing protein [Pyronema omphalodes]
MAARKLQQEVDKTFKRVAEGIAHFESVYEKLQQCTNASQKDKLEDMLKREIKKLQRHRDQIKTWAANSEIKDKKPLLDQRKLIETQMEKFKAVEKEMKTKAYSKEGLLASTRLDPKSQQKLDMLNFLSDRTGDLDRQIEALEAEAGTLTVTLKKGKKNSTGADRVAEVERKVERHKWHQGKLELIMRLLENGQLETEQVERIKEDIKWYVESNEDVDFVVDEDENIYDELNLDVEIAEEVFGMGLDNDRMSSQDTMSIADDASDLNASTKGKEPVSTGRRPSTQVKSPMPAAAQLHTPPTPATPSNGSTKPPAAPARPATELKYAAAATAAAAADKTVGIAPLPPPPGTQAAATPPQPTATTSKQPQPSKASTPSISAPTPEKASTPAPVEKSPSPKPTDDTLPSPGAPPAGPLPEIPAEQEETSPSPSEPATNGVNGVHEEVEAEEECIFHLPANLSDLMTSFEATKKRLTPLPMMHHLLETGFVNAPDSIDTEKPKHYKPMRKYPTPAHYPQDPLPIFDDPALYRRIDSDTLFYVFYYRQGTYQQYLAAKELKRQSWRFHKQYQTWFQRHEEPKTITEEYEQGTYRFFDYESTWMNRRKQDFKFVYKYLEDDL